jgi:polar amino acid transport system substrate-binding protein
MDYFGINSADDLPKISEVPYFGFWIGIFGLAMNYSASQAEHFRGALLNLPSGQFDASLALGMTRLAAIRIVMIPQAIRAAIPSVTNDFIALFKDTSVCSVISVFELTKQYNTDFNTFPKHALELVCVTGVIYLCMSYPLALVARRLEKKVSEAVK